MSGFSCGSTLVLVSGWLVALLLGVLLWSSRTQRRIRLAEEALPALEETIAAIDSLTEAHVTTGNGLEIVENGDFFDALLQDIGDARDSVHLESYVWWRGDICQRVASALVDAAQRGVRVRVLLDAVGSATMDRSLLRRMREGGCRVRRYHGLRLRSLGRLNKRDHRKMAIVDGRVGWIFGHGIAAEWTGSGDGPSAWRDLAVRLRGPAVRRVQGAFARQWMEEAGEPLVDARYFPALDDGGGLRIGLIASSPRGGVSPSSLLHRLLIASAREELVIQNPYFAPGLDVARLLEDAARRGVTLRILTPGPITDSRPVLWAGHHLFERLLAAGAELWRFQPTLNHQKVMLVDRRWCWIGSSNFDERSFDINAEAGLLIDDADLYQRLNEMFERDLERSERIDPEEWRRRPRWRRWLEAGAWLVHQQL